MSQQLTFKENWANNPYPFVAILRGLTPEHAIPVCQGLIDAGMTYIEVPLNTDYAYDVIATLINKFGDQAVIGAGTVLTTEQVRKIKQLGGKIIISPNMNESVIRLTKELGMISSPGVYTVTEAFNALAAGADILKFYPADTIEPSSLKAMLTVLPKDRSYFPVGGVGPDSAVLTDYINAGANGFGIGGKLYKPEFSVDQVIENAKGYINAWQSRNGCNA